MVKCVTFHIFTFFACYIWRAIFLHLNKKVIRYFYSGNMKNIDFLSSINHIDKKATEIICDKTKSMVHCSLFILYFIQTYGFCSTRIMCKKACAFIQHFSTQFQWHLWYVIKNKLMLSTAKKYDISAYFHFAKGGENVNF